VKLRPDGGACGAAVVVFGAAVDVFAAAVVAA